MSPGLVCSFTHSNVTGAFTLNGAHHSLPPGIILEYEQNKTKAAKELKQKTIDLLDLRAEYVVSRWFYSVYVLLRYNTSTFMVSHLSVCLYARTV